MKKRFPAFVATLCLLVLLVGNAAFATNSSSTGSSVTVNGTAMTMTSEYSSSEIPDGFYEAKLDYQGTTYFGGLDRKTESVKLFYLVNSSDASLNGFYLLSSDGTFYKYNSVTLSEKTLMVLTPDSSVTVPDGYTQTRAAIGDKMTDVWVADSATTGTYLVYGSLDGTNLGWFIYSQTDGTVSKYDTASNDKITELQTSVSNLQSELKDMNAKYNNDIGKAKNIYLIELVLCVIFFFLMLNAIIKRRHKTLDLEERIIDLKRNGGQETQNFSKREARRNAKMDAKAERRLTKDDKENDRIASKAEDDRPIAETLKNAYADEAEEEPIVTSGQSAAADPGVTGSLPNLADEFDDYFDADEETWQDDKLPDVDEEPAAPVRSLKQAKSRSAVSDATKIIDTGAVEAARKGRAPVSPEDRVVTMAAAGDSSDFDLDLLEKNLAEMTDKVMNDKLEPGERALESEPEPAPRQMKSTTADIAEVIQSDEDDDFKMDIIDLD